MPTSLPESSQYPGPDSLSYEEALAELEKIVTEIEDGNIGVEEAINAYRRGTGLLKHCRGILDRAEEEIEMLQREENDSSILTPGDDE